MLFVINLDDSDAAYEDQFDPEIREIFKYN